MGLEEFNGYGSGNSSSLPLSWGSNSSPLTWSVQPTQESERVRRPSSFVDLITGKCTLKDVMKEFQMNGSDSPYNPDEENIWSHQADELIGMGPSSAYLRQKSWPEPESTPMQPLLRPNEWNPSTNTSLSIDVTEDQVRSSVHQSDIITAEQLRVLESLPNTVLYSLLRELENERGEKRVRPKRQPDECRFCKNNGEREAYYRAHALRDAAGRVACPVLRAFVCRRCGASGDRAHTLKYCPRATDHERMKSAAMMRSMRMASGRRRSSQAPSTDQYVVFGEPTPSVVQDNNVYKSYEESPLDPLWAALEQKLML